MSVSDFINHFSTQDLAEFRVLYDPSAAGEVITQHGPNGGSAGVEAELDVQYLSSTGAHVQTVVWSVPASNQAPFLYLFAEVANLTDAELPSLFSISYGEPEKGNTADYLHRLDAEFQAVGVRGVSIMIAAGDTGVGTGGCTGGTFGPDWPGTSPSVTTVGGTKLGFLETGTEKAWSGSGGGFSNVFPTPPFQQAAVSNYLTKYSSSLPDRKYFNTTGRAFPDVSAFSVGFLVVYHGAPTPVDGTSCATPTFSGVIGLLNAHRVGSGKPTLGPLNQWIYQNPKGFTDITEGTNQGCLDTDGFPAKAGWDPVTGNGSPLFAALVSMLPN